MLIGVDHFACYSDARIAAEDNVYRMAAALIGTEEAPALTLAFGSGSDSSDSLVYPHPVRDVESLSALLDQAFSSAADEEGLLIYICTHGVYEQDGECGLVLSDGRSDSLLPPQTLSKLLEPYAGHKLLILDACHSGAVIGRGLAEGNASHPFGKDVSVLCSCGALEDSWYWTSEEEEPQGFFYFTHQLCLGISQGNGAPADLNKDGSVSLTELYRYLLENYGISTPVLLLPEGEEIQLHPISDGGLAEALRDVEYSAAYTRQNRLEVGMTVFRPLSLAYRVVSWGEKGWDFDNASVFYDEGGDYNASGYAGYVSTGRKNRVFTFSDTESGYVLLQLLTLEEGRLRSPFSHVVTLLGDACPVTADCTLTQEGLLRIFIHHTKPAVFTVKITCGESSRRLFTREASRPSLSGGTELVTSLPDFHGLCSLSIQAEFASETVMAEGGEIFLP